MKAIYKAPEMKVRDFHYMDVMLSISDNEGEDPNDLVKDRDDDITVWEEF